jgi:fibronectin-binding autotransporter adhesin
MKSSVCRFPRLVESLLAAFVLVAAMDRASAAAVTWTGTTDGDWAVGGVGGNWNGAAAPAAAGDNLVFNTSSNTTITNVPASVSLASGTPILFGVGSSAFTIGTSASTVTLTGGGITNNGTALQTLNFNIDTNGTNRPFSVATGGSITVNGVIAGAGGISKTNTGTLTLNAANTYSGTTTASNGLLVLGDNAALGTSILSIGGSTFTIQGSAARIIPNDVRITSSTPTFGGSNAFEVTGSFTGFGGNRTVAFTNTADTTLSGPVFLSDSATSRPLTLSGTGNVIVSGKISNSNGLGAPGGLLAKTGGSITLSNAASDYSGMTITDGFARNTSFLMGGGAVVTVDADSTGAANAVTAGPLGLGVLDWRGGSIKAGTTARTILNEVILGNGAIAASTGSNDITFSGNVSTNGGLQFQANSTGITTFTGNINIRGGTAVGARTLSISGTGQAVISGVIGNGSGTEGAMLYSNTHAAGVLVSGNNVYGSLTTISAGRVKLGHANALGNSFNTLTNVTNQTTVTAGATLDLNGRTDIIEALTIAGPGVDGMGALINSDTGTTATIAGLQLASIGRAVAAVDWTSATVSFSGGGAGTGATATATIVGGSLTGIVFTNRGTGYDGTPVTVTITGNDGTTPPVTGTVNYNVVTLGVASSIGGAGDIVINTTIQGAGFTKVGAGTVTLAGANTYIGATVINAGTLKLGVSNSIRDISAMTLNTGKFSTGGFSDTLGALTLLDSSVIDLAAGASILAFADSSLSAWSGTLSIWNWTGTPVTGGGTDQLLFGLNELGLTAGQAALVNFYADSGATLIGAGGIMLPSGELVPAAIPEPGIVGLIALGLGAMLLRKRRTS